MTRKRYLLGVLSFISPHEVGFRAGLGFRASLGFYELGVQAHVSFVGGFRVHM